MTTAPTRKPAERRLHTFLQLGGLAAVATGIIFNLIGLVSLAFGSSGHPPTLLFFSVIGLPIIVIGLVMMTIGFTAAARRIRRWTEEQR